MPTKAAYLKLETDPTLNFEFFLCKELKLGTVREMRQRMEQHEFQMWAVFYARKAQAMELQQKRTGDG